MTISAIKENIAASLTNLKGTIESNWKAASTNKKVAIVAATAIVALAALASAIFGPMALGALVSAHIAYISFFVQGQFIVVPYTVLTQLLSPLATTLTASLAAGVLGLSALAIPASTLLKKPQ